MNHPLPTLIVSLVAFAGGLWAAPKPEPARIAEPPKSPAQVLKLSKADADEEPPITKGYTLTSAPGVGGLWVQRDGRNAPFAAVYSQQTGGQPAAVVGLSRNQKGDGHDFAIVANKDEVYFQIRDAKGEFHLVPATALLKLEEKK